MKVLRVRAIAVLAAILQLSTICAVAQAFEAEKTVTVDSLVATRPFSAIKYARTVRVLQDGKQQFIRNQRYPILIARDAKGKVRMQDVDSDSLLPECDKPTQLLPPPCPAWSVFVVDPVEQTVSHWVEGEAGARETVEMPLSPANLERTIHSTSALPEIPPDFDPEDGVVTQTKLGTKLVEGVSATGKRITIVYPLGHSGGNAPSTRIHEVWVSPSLNLIVRVIDGDPSGVETIWGLEKISLHPDPSLFRPPPGYQSLHQRSDVWAEHDFDLLDSWFAR